MNIPPLLSRTPPPLSDSENNDNDDADFGNFAVYNDIVGGSYEDYQSAGKTATVEDSASEDSGLCTGSSSMGQAHSPFETSPTTGLKGLSNGDGHLFESLPLSDCIQGHSQQPQHDDSILINEEDGEGEIEVDEVGGIENGLELGSDHLISEDLKTIHQIIEKPTLGLCPDTLSSDASNQDFINKVDEFINEHDSFEELKIYEELGTNHLILTIDSDDAPTFSYICENVSDLAIESSSQRIDSINKDSSHCCDQSYTYNSADVPDDQDDFSDFQASSVSSELAQYNQEEQLPLHHIQANYLLQQAGVNNESVLEASFVHKHSALIPFLQELVGESHVWCHLHSLEDTHALRYQWSSSSSNRKLLSALKIDSRNILCSFWSKSVKAGDQDVLSLDLVQGSEYKDISNHQTPAVAKNVVPDAHFDWVGSGLTNPLDSGSTTLLDMPHLSFTCASKSIPAESPFVLSCTNDSCVTSIPEFEMRSTKISQQAEEILSSLPDRSYMKKTYIVFKRFP